MFLDTREHSPAGFIEAHSDTGEHSPAGFIETEATIMEPSWVFTKSPAHMVGICSLVFLWEWGYV